MIDQYKELKTVFKQYIAHGRSITICVRESIYKKGSFDISVITVGIAICNPEDEYNMQFGMRIAEGRAKKAIEKEGSALMYVVGSFEDTPIQSDKFVLSQIADTAYYHVKHNPEQYIHNFSRKQNNKEN